MDTELAAELLKVRRAWERMAGDPNHTAPDGALYVDAGTLIRILHMLDTAERALASARAAASLADEARMAANRALLTARVDERARVCAWLRSFGDRSADAIANDIERVMPSNG